MICSENSWIFGERFPGESFVVLVLFFMIFFYHSIILVTSSCP